MQLEILVSLTAGYDRRHGMSGRTEYSPMRARIPARKMVAIYDYNPHELSPNVDVEVLYYSHLTAFTRFIVKVKVSSFLNCTALRNTL